MKNFAKIIGFTWMLFLCYNSLAANHRYYFNMPASTPNTLSSFELTLFPGGDVVVLRIGESKVLDLNYRIESVDRKIKYYDGETLVTEEYKGIVWNSSNLQLNCGDAPFYPLVYWDPQITFSASNENLGVLTDQEIGSDETIQLTVIRNDYTGTIPVYISITSTLPSTPQYLTTISTNSNHEFVPNSLWNAFMALHGTLDNILTKSFYMHAWWEVFENYGQYATVQSDPVGPIYLSDGLKATTSEEDTVAICGKLTLEPSHLRPPYTVSVTRGSRNKTFGSESFPVEVDFSLINSLGFGTDTAIFFSIFKGPENVNTKTISKSFLGLNPDVSGVTFFPGEESCETSNDATITLNNLPVIPDVSLRFWVTGGEKFDTTTFASNIIIPVKESGTYKVEAAYEYSTTSAGCKVTIGNYNIPLADKLTIVDTSVTWPTCSYKENGKITLTTSAGVGTVKFNLDGTGDYNSVIENLKSASYEIYAYDEKNCKSDPVTVEIPSIPKLEVSLDITETITCFGDSIKGILAGTGGTGDLRFNVDGKNIENNGFAYFKGLLHHDPYEIIIFDANNCSDTVIIPFEEPSPLEFQSEAFTAWDLRCHDDNSGKITLHGQGGTGKITGNLFDQSNNSYIPVNDTSFAALSAQSYSAYLIDENECLSDTLTGITLTQPEGITFTHTTSHPETCKGTEDASIEVTLSAAADSLQWYRVSNQLLPGHNTPELSNVGPGTYELKAFYNNSICETKTGPIQISDIEAISFTTNEHQACPDGQGGGTVGLDNITHARLPITCVFNNGTPQPVIGNIVSFSNLNVGTYTLEIRDSAYIMGGIYAEKCKVSQSFTITPKSTPVITPDDTRPLCFGDSNGAITVTDLSGLDNPVVHAWLNAANDSIGSGNALSNIPAGQYSAVITDDYHCKTLQTGVILNEPARLVINNLNVENAACVEVSDGSINISASGGITPYQYSGNGGLTWQANPNLLNLASDNYQIRVRDHNQCISDSSIAVGAFYPVISVAKYDSVSCYNLANGAYTLSASGSKSHSQGYSFFLLGNPSASSTGIFSELDAGTYRFYGLDSEGCYTDTLTALMYEPLPMQVNLTLHDSASCSQYTGKIGYAISGGNGKYNLQWFNTAIGNTTYLDTTALRTGNYTLTATDRKGCEASDVIFIPDRPAPVITGITQLEQTWCGKHLGVAKVDVTGGSPRYGYLWDNEKKDTLAVADSLNAGTYHVLVTDRFNCTAEAQITLVDGPAINMTSLVNDPHCGQNDGKAELSITGGVYPYLFHWPDTVSNLPLTDSSMSELFAGIYPVKISDAVGCEKIFPVTLKDLDGPSIDHISITSSWCGLPVGKARALVSKGTRPYTYNWMPTDASVSVGHDSLITTLKAGDYHLLITDVHNCKTVKSITIADSVELQPHLALTALDSAACNKPLGKIRVATGNGLAPYSYAWNTGAESDSIVNAPRGIYRVVSTDGRGCRDSLEVIMPDRKAPVITFVSKESAYCGRPLGKATVAASLGSLPYHAYLVSSPGTRIPLTHNPLTGKYTATLDSLLPLPSAYRIRVTDADGCESPDISVIIDDNNPMSLTLLDISPVSCHGGNDGSAVVRAGNGFEPYTYEWSVNSVNNDTNTAMPAGVFDVTVTDAKSCVKTLYVTSTPITQPAPLTLGSSFITHPPCHGICDAHIEATGAGGNGGYIYVWNETDTAQTGTALCAGENTLKIIDTKGCTFTGSFTVIDAEPLSGTDLPGEITLCSGQHYLADPGNEWTGVSWTSDNAFASDMHVADIDMQGTYYMTGYSDKGCLIQDTVKVIFSDDLLDAQFLMMSQAYAGDTVVIIEVSWPVAEQYKWEFPEAANIIYDHENYKELVFDEAGTYYVQLSASLAGCSSIKGKYIEVLEKVEENNNPIPDENPALIKSFGVYPNPASREFNVEVKLSETTDIRFEIISMSTGQSIRVINNYGLDDYLMPVNIDQLAPGSYIVRLVAGNEAKTKIIIVR